MLTKLLPEQVSKFWDIIKYGIEESLPPIAYEHPDKMNRILTSILCNKVVCWVSYRREDGKTIFEGIVLTKLLYDEVSYSRSLLIYSIYGYESVDSESWINAFKSLVKYAKYKKCSRVVAYTKISEMIKRAKDVGGDIDYTFITWDTKKLIKKFNRLD